ncbi:MAG TPA: enolase C-terminal domain-like protein [Chthoniobacterales bacterium]|nr:enolase C-terminal domain-like protein [Chthoniobacterales bacterium]
MKSPLIEKLTVSTYRIPTDAPESDGTYEWDSTTLVLVEAAAGDIDSLGYTYADQATAKLIDSHLKQVVLGRDALSPNSAFVAMTQSIRNLGRPGICSMAISAIDTALWDLKARLLGLSLVRLFGQVREAMPLYGSGGFTSYSNDQLQEQLEGWVDEGISRVKMKIGRDAKADPERVAAAREAIGDEAELFVDANGGYSRKQALELSYVFSEMDVTWFEEPVSSDDLDGLRLMRDDGPPGMDIAAGEYGYDVTYFERMLAAGAVDVLQADATRCGGYTGFFQAATLCEAHHLPLSSHCAPALHLPIGCAARPFRHAEYFHDHVRIERMFFDGATEPNDGVLTPDLSRPGNGLTLKRRDAEKFAI